MTAKHTAAQQIPHRRCRELTTVQVAAHPFRSGRYPTGRVMKRRLKQPIGRLALALTIEPPEPGNFGLSKQTVRGARVCARCLRDLAGPSTIYAYLSARQSRQECRKGADVALRPGLLSPCREFGTAGSWLGQQIGQHSTCGAVKMRKVAGKYSIVAAVAALLVAPCTAGPVTPGTRAGGPGPRRCGRSAGRSKARTYELRT